MFKFIKNTMGSIVLIIRVLSNKNLINPLKRDCLGKRVTVLANGPSLKDELPQLEWSEKFKNTDFIVLNFFAFEEVFFKIKPEHYCFADPMFFHENHKKELVQKLFNVMQNNISWDINLYIPSSRYNAFLKYSKLTNKHIKIVKINFTEYLGYESFRNFFYKKGLAIPRPATVANLAIFVGLNKGFSDVHIYGVDHTFFESLCINDQNQLCNKDIHFYDEGEVSLKPILRNDNDEIWKISDYLEGITEMFKSHDLLSSYSKYLDSRILNCTKCSMIDSYERLEH